MKYNSIIYEKLDQGIIKITLNRPKSLNAINNELGSELKMAFEEVLDDTDASVGIITGAGRAFCAGADIKDPPFARGEDAMGSLWSIVRKIKIPLIAAVNGYAITAGFELALACDIIIASENAAFRDTHALAGIIAGSSNQCLPRLVGEKKAKEIIFTSEFLYAQEAEKIGMINKVVPPEKLDDETLLFAQKIASQPRKMIQKLKQVIDTGMGMDYRTALMFEDLESELSVLSVSNAQFINQGKIMKEGAQAQLNTDQ